MKQFLTFVSLMLLGCCCQKENDEKMTIEGMISGNVPGKIEYTVPLNGISYFGFENSVQPDSLGHFKISLSLDKASFIELSNGHEPYGTIVAEPGMLYRVQIKQKKGDVQFTVKSKNSKGQELYNQNPNRSMLSGHFELEARKYSEDSVPAEIMQGLGKSRLRNVAKYDSLLDAGIISKRFHELVIADQIYFYAGARTSIALMNYLLSERNKIILTEEEYSRLWGDTFKEFSVGDPNLMRSPWFFYYVKSYLWYKDFVEGKVNPEDLSETKKQRLIHTRHIDLAKKYLTGKQLEYYCAAYIYMEAISKNYEKELVTLFEQFEKENPSSEYIPYIESEIIPIIAFHRKQDEVLNENIHFLEDVNSINSLKEAVKSINSQKIYVDIWATWCGPCKQEFKHNDRLYDLLSNEKTTMLYISVDKDDKVEKWREMIKYYQLEGYHLIANKDLYKDLRRLRGKDTFGIPWHILTDGNGNVIEKYAGGSTEIETLEKQLQDN
ncbi:TlpA family protein disulfide reductase [Echinicola strongylocentroti]|uniref:TlpA family protein disulfide reductase n=1 Tax=Echinicola strongylocentroti TaxID=1795355 RepID=A0A2Z4IEB9_9BACT|nr:TlpA disulfide reductase family protein [Echinicola strongylocentroti]AWW29412.1 TlpA family protein disulfide reductase [Echinicola strongylocentroti]